MAMTPTDARAAHDGELVDELDQQVRGLVRSEGVDPQRDAGLVRRIVEGVVRDHDERSLTGMVAPCGDIDSLVGELVARGLSGFRLRSKDAGLIARREIGGASTSC